MKRIVSFAAAVVLLAALAGCAPEGTPPGSSAVGSDFFPVPQSSAQPVGEAVESEQLFDTLELKVTRGTLSICTGDAFSFTRKNGEDAECEIRDGVLFIDQEQDGETLLILPKTDVYAALTLTVGDGHVYAEEMPALQALKLEVSRGEVSLSAVSIAGDSTLSVGQGSAFVSGDLGTSVSADCREGHLSLEIPQMQEEYNYAIELSMGNIHLGSREYHGRSVSESVDNGAGRSMTLCCARGALSVEFGR